MDDKIVFSLEITTDRDTQKYSVERSGWELGLDIAAEMLHSLLSTVFLEEQVKQIIGDL